MIEPMRRSMLATLTLYALGGCTGDVTSAAGEASTTTSTEASSTGSIGATTAPADSSSTSRGTSGDECVVGGDAPCAIDRPVPRPPVDCAEAMAIMQGDVVIEPGGDAPSILEGVVRVEGSIRIVGTELSNLTFMACVREVVGDLVIEDNDALVDLYGLWSVETVGGDFVFRANDALDDFDGLPNLTQLGGLILQQNAELSRISGFTNLVGTSGYVGMDGKPAGGDFKIQDHPQLQSIEGFSDLLVVNGVLTVTNNPMLCLSSVACIVTGIVQPATPPDSWEIADTVCC